jgi:GTP diphosphokinase / guanosine-3',5'-bis(diphosphate) 3'-diphosphatase
MHRLAESGVAAHWLYKDDADKLSELQSRTHQWLQSLLEIQRQTWRLERVPRARQGRPVPRRGLRLHAQGQDPFAAARSHGGRLRLRVHTDVGNRCVAARINGELVPLAHSA